MSLSVSPLTLTTTLALSPYAQQWSRQWGHSKSHPDACTFTTATFGLYVAMLSQSDFDEPIRVVVTPSQASYFAGERLSITVTMTNMRAPQGALGSHSATHSQSAHKRGAHSVSYVPMARPPTSPGTRTVLPVGPARPSLVGGVVVRRGIIGKTRPSKGGDEANDQVDQTRRRLLLNRSQSISLSTHDFRSDTQEDMKGKSPARTLRALETSVPSPTSPRISSPLARSASVPAHHPHARKLSVLDGQVATRPLNVPLAPLTPNASTFSLTLDAIVEGAASPMPPQTPATPSPITRELLSHPQIPSSASVPTDLQATSAGDMPQYDDLCPGRPQAGLGRGPPPIIVQPPKARAASAATAVPSTELILYSYAQLSGSVSICPLSQLPQEVSQVQALQELRRSLLKSKAIGGGSMEIASYSPNSLASGQQSLPLTSRRPTPTHMRSSSLSGSLFSMLSPTSLLSSAPSSSTLQGPSRVTRHARSPSVLGSLFQSASGSATYTNGLGLSMNPAEEADIDDETPLPTFEVQPSMLAVDLNLGPGESRSYSYELDLPRNLPPSYRGRTLKLVYEFVVGICRAPGSSVAGAGSHSRVMKVPIRIYNNVVVGIPPTPYDLLWPVDIRSRPSSQRAVNPTVVEVRDSLKKYRSSGPGQMHPDTLHSVRMYAHSLLSRSDSSMAPKPVSSSLTFEIDSSRDLEEADLSCREAVEVLTRNPKKISFDVNKDGVKVAVLTFTKSAYRLGEPVLGVVELNARASRARVLKLSALLEAHESLPNSLAQPPPSSSRQMRRIHAEHHSSFMTSTLRTTFSLDIPPDASPAFQITAPPSKSGGSSSGGLEWKIRLYLLVAIATPNCQEGVDGIRLKNLVVDGPRGEWGTTWTAARTIAPSERPSPLLPIGGSSPNTPKATQSWTSFLTSAFLGSSEAVSQYHDGDEDLEGGEEEDGSEEDWKEVKVEMVECEVPIRVWPGNTAFKATEVVFEV